MARTKKESPSSAAHAALVKELPILFNADMVRGILAGEKTQTRRIVKSQPRATWAPVILHYHPIVINRAGREEPGPEVFGASDEEEARKCPYGQPGDRLWVRESWQAWGEFDGVKANGISAAAAARLNYLADGNTWVSRRRPSIHMPRWACRILLEITEVCVERLQTITEADARAEGAEPFDVRGLSDLEIALLSGPLAEAENPYRNGYALLWDSIYGSGDWDRNPWVWAVSFRRIDGAEQTRIKSKMECVA